jgi:FKBP-type peptidyl-prolyl cis-trans isomerase SlyD
MQVAANTVVSFDYVLTGGDGKVIDSNEGAGPLAYIHGQGQIVPGLEEALDGRSAGDKFQVTIQPDKAYGVRDSALVQVVARDMFESVNELEVGMRFRATLEDGEHVFTIVGLDGKQVTIDGNHPLAGATLNFDVTVVEVRAATAEELDHGHVHGAGGHH